jgi:tetracycline 7-halogenase / FADH2 O2-dependent halogenase
MNAQHFEIVVVGSGFGGSLMAMIARRLGFSVALIERGSHPRFAIGESSTPLANLLLEEIAEQYDLPAVRPLCKWGFWQRELPQIAAGIKRGFTFYHHEFGHAFAPDPERKRQLLVGASPNGEIADTHWYRPDFDHYLVQQAQKIGVTYLDETILSAAEEEPNGMRLTGSRRGQPVQLAADFVIDATGPRGFLWRTLGLSETQFPTLPPTQALYSHFSDVGPLPDSFGSVDQSPPYPPERAAVHHVFPGGWVWVLKFNNGITSAGVAATDTLAHELDFNTGEPAWQKLIVKLPSLAEIFASAKAVLPFVHLQRLAFRTEIAADRYWAKLPSAAGFVDPLLSTGFPLTLLGVSRLGRLLRSRWGKSSFAAGLKDYAQLTMLELDAAARLVGALYATMDRFPLFQDLSLLYFAAAGYSEAARRLGKIELADSFLLCRHPLFAEQFRKICDSAQHPRSGLSTEELSRQIRDAIEPFDVAGLADRSRHAWYPALPGDLYRNAAKLQASENEITLMLRKCGMEPVEHFTTEKTAISSHLATR